MRSSRKPSYHPHLSVVLFSAHPSTGVQTLGLYNYHSIASHRASFQYPSTYMITRERLPYVLEESPIIDADKIARKPATLSIL